MIHAIFVEKFTTYDVENVWNLVYRSGREIGFDRLDYIGLWEIENNNDLGEKKCSICMYPVESWACFSFWIVWIIILKFKHRGFISYIKVLIGRPLCRNPSVVPSLSWTFIGKKKVETWIFTSRRDIIIYYLSMVEKKKFEFSYYIILKVGRGTERH